MKKVYLATGWEDTEHRLYHKKENALEDFQEMLDVAEADEDLEIDEITKEELEAGEIFCCAVAKDKDGQLLFAFVSMLEFEDEE